MPIRDAVVVGGVAILVAAQAVFAADTPQALSLEQAFQAALEKNEGIQQSKERLQQAHDRFAQARGRLFPELSASLNHLIQPEPSDPIARAFSPGQQTTVTLTAVQPIFKGLREFAGMRRFHEMRLSQEAQGKLAAQRLYRDVASSYLNVLSLEQDLRNVTDQVEIYGKRVEELQGRAQRGESSTTELLSARASFNSLRAEQQLTQGQLKMARESFSSLTGESRDCVLQDPKLVAADKAVTAEDLTRYLGGIESRPDVEAARADEEAADAGVGIARGGHFPTLDAVANYYPLRPGFLRDLKWDVSFRLSVPLFAGGVTHFETREAISRSREAQLELARVRRVAEEEIRSLHESLRARVEHLAFLRESVELAQKNVTVSQNEFRRGLIRNIDVQMALSEYRGLRRSLDQAHFAAQIDQLKLAVAAGAIPQGVTPQGALQ